MSRKDKENQVKRPIATVHCMVRRSMKQKSDLLLDHNGAEPDQVQFKLMKRKHSVDGIQPWCDDVYPNQCCMTPAESFSECSPAKPSPEYAFGEVYEHARCSDCYLDETSYQQMIIKLENMVNQLICDLKESYRYNAELRSMMDERTGQIEKCLCNDAKLSRMVDKLLGAMSDCIQNRPPQPLQHHDNAPPTNTNITIP